MITDGKKLHYLSVKKLPALLRGITSSNNADFSYINGLHSFKTENKLKKHYNVCKNYDYCYVEMPKQDNKILKYNHGENSMKVPFIIYSHLESFLEKINTCHNNPKKSSTTKINEHKSSDYSLFTHCSCDTTKNNLDYYRGENCMKNICLDLREHATEKIDYEKKEMILLTNEEKKYIVSKKFVIYAKKDLVMTMTIKHIIK